MKSKFSKKILSILSILVLASLAWFNSSTLLERGPDLAQALIITTSDGASFVPDSAIIPQQIISTTDGSTSVPIQRSTFIPTVDGGSYTAPQNVTTPVSCGSCNAQTPSCGQTTYGTDSCGRMCNRVGDICPVPVPSPYIVPQNYPPVSTSTGSCGNVGGIYAENVPMPGYTYYPAGDKPNPSQTPSPYCYIRTQTQAIAPAVSCQSLNCQQAPVNCYYANQVLYSCNPNMPVTCGTLVCPASPVSAGTVCAQIITRACNSQNPAQCLLFPTPCDVPSGWFISNQASTPQTSTNTNSNSNNNQNNNTLSVSAQATSYGSNVNISVSSTREVIREVPVAQTITREIIREVPVQQTTITQPAVIQAAASQPQVVKVSGDTQAKELPKTGLPLLGYALAGLIPLGYRFRSFGRTQKSSITANFLREERLSKEGKLTG